MAARKSGNTAQKAPASSAKKKDQEEAEKPASAEPVAVKTDADTGDGQGKTAGDGNAEKAADQAEAQTGSEESQTADAETGDGQDKATGEDNAEKTADQADAQTGGEEEQDADTEDDRDFLLPEAIMVKTRRGLTTFRRAGLRFGQEPVTLKIADLTDDQIGAILAEPNLEVKEA